MTDLTHNGARLIHGDCLEKMKLIPDGSVDLVLTDPPYGTMEGHGKSVGFEQKHDWDTAIPPETVHAELERLLRPNGHAVLFSQEPYTSALITKAIHGVPFRYRMAWNKFRPGNVLLCKKAPVSILEDINVFAKIHPKHDHGGDHPLREYAEKVRDFVALSAGQLREILGNSRLDHFWRAGSSQFGLCTAAAYAQAEQLFGLRTRGWFREFSDLKGIDTAFKNELNARMAAEFPKVFNLPEGEAKLPNLLEFKKDTPSHHPTQKPVALLTRLIETYTHAGDTVLDFTMGSGSTGVAALACGRKFTGIELDPTYYGIACGRVWS